MFAVSHCRRPSQRLAMALRAALILLTCPVLPLMSGEAEAETAAVVTSVQMLVKAPRATATAKVNRIERAGEPRIMRGVIRSTNCGHVLPNGLNAPLLL